MLFAGLYFAEGAPIGFLWWTLPVLLRRRGMAVEDIGALTGLLVLPWALKFVWAPLVDLGRRPGFSFRGWIVVAQILMIATLAAVATIGLEASPGVLTALLLGHAIAAATQDVAIDALAIRSTPEAQRGAINGWMQVGMLTGRGIFGGAVLVLADALGDEGLLWLLVAVLAATMVLHPFYRAPAADGNWADHARAFGGALRSVLASGRTWIALVFAVTSGAAFEVVGALAGPYLVDRGYADTTIGTFYGGPAVLALGGGAFLGGRVADRLGHARATAVLAGCLVGGTVLFVGTAAAGPLVWGGLGVLYLTAGAFIAASYSLFMDLTDGRLSSTQFSAYMGATNLCEAWSARLGGLLAGGPGYPAAFVLGAVVTTISLPLLWLLRNPTRGRRGGG